MTRQHHRMTRRPWPRTLPESRFRCSPTITSASSRRRSRARASRSPSRARISPTAQRARRRRSTIHWAMHGRDRTAPYRFRERRSSTSQRPTLRNGLLHLRDTDSNGDSGTATVTVTVSSANDPPLGVQERTFSIIENTTLTIAAGQGVLQGAYDVDNKLVDASGNEIGGQTLTSVINTRRSTARLR